MLQRHHLYHPSQAQNIGSDIFRGLRDGLSWDQCPEKGLVLFLKRVVQMQGHFQFWKV